MNASLGVESLGAETDADVLRPPSGDRAASDD